MNGKNFRISLRQWHTFHAVVDCDGFTGAASHLHVSQSAISYTLAKLQDQLGIPLLKIEGRKAQITEEGKILLNRSRELIRNAMELEALAESLRNGWGPEIRLIMDPGFPSQLLMRALHKLAPYPTNTRLSVLEATIEHAEKALHERTADLAIGSRVPVGFLGNELMEIEYVAVAHPDHPLFELGREVTLDDLEKQLQIVISGSNDYMAADVSYRLPKHSRIWNVSGFDTAIGALRHCLGYAWLPRYRVQSRIDQNQIQVLPLSKGAVFKTTMHLIFGRSLAPDSGAIRFAEALRALAASEPPWKSISAD